MTGIVMRLIMALIVGIVSLFSYCSSKDFNPVTGENQYISLTPRQEIALGLQATPGLIKQYGGRHPDQKYQNYVKKVGRRVVSGSDAKDTPWRYEFHLLSDNRTVNAFALPGGQIFITAGLLKLFDSQHQLAGVLAHEIAHVVARHSSQRIAKQNLTRGITNAVMVASGDARAGQVSALLGKLINMKFSRSDEVQADRLGVFFMMDAGFDPQGMIQLMKILNQRSRGGRVPEFFSTHPNPENRLQKIASAIRDKNG